MKIDNKRRKFFQKEILFFKLLTLYPYKQISKRLYQLTKFFQILLVIWTTSLYQLPLS